ncbi:MAG: ABC transporter substrate-binding protein [Deltaproteobacteria bacterium]|nr:ABC transporter substrate-binding protein [Deltaproteobacteria bacterium]
MNRQQKKMSRREFVRTMAAGAAGTMVLSVGVPSLFAATPRRGGVVKCGMSFLIQTPDPHRRNGAWARQDAALAWEGLVDPISLGERFRIAAEKGAENVPEIKPMLADSWDIENNGARYVFHLKKGVKFHDGKEFDSGDVKWNWERIRDPAHFAAARKSMAQYIESIETPDRYTAVANLTQPYAGFLMGNAWVNAPMMPKDCIPYGKNFGQGDHKSDRAAPPGTGPFEMVEFKQNDKAVFKAHKDYRIPGLPYLDGVEFLVVKDQPRTLALRSGDLHYIYGVLDDYFATLFKNKKLYQTFEADNLMFYPWLFNETLTIYLNCHPTKGNSPFKDEKVRQALSLAIDRKGLAQALYGNRGIPAVQGFLPEESIWGFDNIKVPAQDIAKAKQLLKEAGYSDGLEVEFAITPTFGKNDQMAQIVQQMVRPAGFRVKILSQMGLQYWSHLVKMDYQMMVFHTGGDDPMSRYYGFLHTDNTKTTQGYSFGSAVKDPEMDRMLDDMAAEIDVMKRREKFKEIVLRTKEKAYFLPYMRYALANGWSKKVKNFHPENYYIAEQAFREAWLES